MGDTRGGATGGSHDGPALRFYLRMALRATQRPCSPASKMTVSYPIWPTASGNHDVWSRYVVSREPAVWWWHAEAPADGGVLLAHGAYLHSHRARFGGFMIVRGFHSPLSLGGLSGAHCAVAGRNDAACSSVTAARQRLLERAAEKGALICHDETAKPSYALLPADEDAGTGGYYDRPGRIACAAHTFGPHEPWTIFSFNDLVWAPQVDVFLQHTMLFAYYAPPAGVHAHVSNTTFAFTPGMPGSKRFQKVGVWSMRCGPRGYVEGPWNQWEEDSLRAQSERSCPPAGP